MGSAVNPNKVLWRAPWIYQSQQLFLGLKRSKQSQGDGSASKGVFSPKPEDLSWIPPVHMLRERTDPCKLASDLLHRHAVALMPPYTPIK